jgi:hypothetical protein
MNKHFGRLLIYTSLFLTLCACNPIQAQEINPSPITDKTQSTEPTISSPTEEAEETIIAEPSPISTATESEKNEASTAAAQPTQAKAETPAPMDSAFTLVQTSAEENWRFSFSIEQAEPIDQTYYALVGEHNRKYDCVTLADYGFPNRLYCYGRIPRVDDWIDITVYETGYDTPVFAGEAFISLDEVP